MKIIIIEDDQNKLKQIEAFIKKHRPFTIISVCRSYQSGLSTVLTEPADLIILDMSMPTYDQSPHENGGRKRPFAGKDILRQMMRREIASPVVIVTQFTRFGEESEAISLDELRQELSHAHYPNYIETIYYSAEAANWEQSLLSVLDRYVA